MPLGPLAFLTSSSASPFDEILERATSQSLTSENWDLILTINDKVTVGGAKSARDCLTSIKKRLNHRDPHVVLLCLSVLDSCMCNCGKTFQNEVYAKEFLSELKNKATDSNAVVADKSRELIKKWVDEIKDSSNTSLNSLYMELKRDGYVFPSPTNKNATASKIVALENALKEEEDLNKAIQLSLKEKSVESSTAMKSVYPSSVGLADNRHQTCRPVKALYDFEAAEDNELTFKAGDLITVVDDNDVNWWRGKNEKGEGLFPASFVTADLSIDIDQISAMEKKRSVQFDDNVKVESIETKTSEEPPTIDEEKLCRCLDLLQHVDPSGELEDAQELLNLEEQSLRMAPLIDAELTRYDRQMDQLTNINLKLMDALHLYHSAMATFCNTASIPLSSQDCQTQSFQQQSQSANTSNLGATYYGQLDGGTEI